MFLRTHTVLRVVLASSLAAACAPRPFNYQGKSCDPNVRDCPDGPCSRLEHVCVLPGSFGAPCPCAEELVCDRFGPEPLCVPSFRQLDPPDNQRDLPTPVTLSWSAPEAPGQVFVDLSPSDLFAPEATLALGPLPASQTSLELPEEETHEGVAYHWRVRVVLPLGQFLAVDAPFSFVVQKTPGAFRLDSPAHDSLCVYPAQLVWTPSQDAQRYLLALAREDVFLDHETLPVTTTHFAPQALELDTSYLWQVFAQNSQGEVAAENGPFRFRTGPAIGPPEAARPLAPADAAVTGPSPEFSWDPGASATSYLLLVQRAADAESTVVHQAMLPQERLSYAYDGPALAPDVTYTWQVVAANCYGNTPLGEVRTFVIGYRPSPFSLVAPEDGSLALLPPVHLAWTNPEGELSFRVQLAKEESFTAPTWQDVLPADTTQVSAGTVESGETYYWRVLAENAVGQRTSETFEFSLLPGPAPFELSSPAHRAVLVSRTPSFEWQPATHAESYHLRLWRQGPEPPQLVLDRDLDDTSFVLASVEIFTDANAGDFTALPGSPLIDLGSYRGAAERDADGTLVDVGAYGGPEPFPSAGPVTGCTAGQPNPLTESGYALYSEDYFNLAAALHHYVRADGQCSATPCFLSIAAAVAAVPATPEGSVRVVVEDSATYGQVLGIEKIVPTGHRFVLEAAPGQSPTVPGIAVASRTIVRGLVIAPAAENVVAYHAESESNLLERCVVTGSYGELGTNWHGGVRLRLSQNEVRHNLICGNTTGVRLHAWGSENYIHNNLIVGNQSGVEIYNHNAGNTVSNNTFSSMQRDIFIGDNTGVDNHIFDNAFAKTSGYAVLTTAQPSCAANLQGAVFAYNVYHRVTDAKLVSHCGVERDLGSWQEATSLDLTSREVQDALAPGAEYVWQVEAHNRIAGTPSTNGPSTFTTRSE